MATKRDGPPSVSLISAQRNYIEKMLNNVPDMKVLIMDNETTQMVSMIYSQTDILKRQVFLTDKISNTRAERMMHLKAVVYIRPTDENIRLLSKELSNPKYKNYHIYFSNIVGKDKLSALARADEHEVIVNMYEYYADYFAINHDLFTLNISGSLLNSLPRSRWDANQQASFNRQCQGAMSALLSLKWKPIIRFQSNSDLAQHFARTLQQKVVQENKLFTFGSSQRNQQPPVCLILDRRDDPVTPLLTQWTYQAMVHELIGLDDNRVNLSNAPNIKKDMREVVLSCVEDEFFNDHMYDNFGDLGQACKQFLALYQRKYKDNQKIESIEDMQNFVERYPQFKALSNNVSKHVAVVGELSRLVSEHNMMDQSQLEQELACDDDHTAQLRTLKTLLEDPNLAGIDALRLVMLYALRYEDRSGNQTEALKRTLSTRNGDACSSAQIQLIDIILEYAGAAKRGGDLYGQQKGVLSNLVKSVTKGVNGVENVYTQHKPMLSEVLDLLIKGKLKDNQYPYAREGVTQKGKATDVMIFMMGGATYEEGTIVREFNKSQNGKLRVILGGPHIHNSKSYMEELGMLNRTPGRSGGY